MLQHTEVAFSSEAVKKIEEQSHAWKHLCNLKAMRIGRGDAPAEPLVAAIRSHTSERCSKRGTELGRSLALG